MEEIDFLVNIDDVCDTLANIIKRGKSNENGVWFGGQIEEQVFITKSEVLSLKKVMKELKKRGL